jgi:hypothetical protein
MNLYTNFVFLTFVLVQTALAYDIIYSVNVGDEPVRDSNGIYYRKDNNTMAKSFKCIQYNSLPYDKLLYRKQRQGNFSYDLPATANGDYTIILKFTECCKAPINRVFDLYLNQHLVKANINVFKEVGLLKILSLHVYFSICDGKLYYENEEIRTFGGSLRLEFVSIKDDAVLSALLLVRGDNSYLPSSLFPTNSTEIYNKFRICKMEKTGMEGMQLVEKNETYSIQKRLSPYTILNFYHVSNTSLNINVINSGAGESG